MTEDQVPRKIKSIELNVILRWEDVGKYKWKIRFFQWDNEFIASIWKEKSDEILSVIADIVEDNASDLVRNIKANTRNIALP